MPNTKADLGRIRLNWERARGVLMWPDYGDELLAIAERLLRERDALREGIEDIADRLYGWTDHDGIGPEDALRGLLTPNETNTEGENR